MVSIVKNFLVTLNNVQQIAIKTPSKRVIQKTLEASSNLIGNKIANTITVFQKVDNKIIQKQLQMTSDNEIPKKRYISPEERQKTIVEMRIM